MWKWLRVGVLLSILVSIGGGQWLSQRRIWAWQEPVPVALYPIVADDAPATARYVRALNAARFAGVERFFAEEGRRYGLLLGQPVRILLQPALTAAPPPPPATASGLAVVWWSLQLRYYAWRSTRAGDGLVRLFVLYHDGQRMPALPHSLGLERGHIGVVHLFADAAMAGSNQVVLAHELLHTFGASDRYDPATNLPLAPLGLGDADQRPLYPQAYAEIMAGRRALSATDASIPLSLGECLVGPETAAEIHWARR